MASSFVGDFKAGDRVDLDLFTGTDSTGLPTAVTGGSACVIKRTSGTPAAGSLAGLGIQMTVSGTMNFVTVFTGSDSTYYATGADYHVFWGYAAIGSTTITGYPIGHFSIQNRTLNWGSVSAPTTTVNLSGTSTKAVEPTVAGRTLDVSAGGEAGLDWANIGSPTTTVNLSGTTVNQTTSANVMQVQGATINALISGRIDANTQVIANGAIAAATFAAGAIDAAAIAASAIGSSEIAAGAITTAAFAAGAIDAAAIAANAIGSSELAASAQNAIADAILLRDVATGSSASSTRNVQAALRMIVNKTAITGSSNPYTLTFYQEDDSTSFQTAALTFSANTFGVSTADPA